MNYAGWHLLGVPGTYPSLPDALAGYRNHFGGTQQGGEP
jgi:hypothetical protein